MNAGIVFQVETSRILQILAHDIYDSPMALLRENLQNAYDAIRMRFAGSGQLSDGGRIDITVADGMISITDNGIGMSEEVLRQNFWKAGSSGKNSVDARRAGVVGTFGIGAMANFGVCTRLTVETRTEDGITLRSTADRDGLRIAEECITLERLGNDRDVGTTVAATLDATHPISARQAANYLDAYVALLPVPVYLNGALISQNEMEAKLATGNRQFVHLTNLTVSDDLVGGSFDVRADTNGRLLVIATSLTLSGQPIEGSMALLQNGGPLMGLRSRFGLAPVPAIGAYQLGGFADLEFLQPTAGREALSRDSIARVTRVVSLAERAASEAIAASDFADRNNAFLSWALNHNRFDLVGRISIRALPDEKDIPLDSAAAYIGASVAHYYTGVDRQIVATFAGQGAVLFQVAQAEPRRGVQLRFLRDKLKVAEVPDSVRVTRVFKGTELTIAEASIVVRIASILRDDYFIPDVEVVLADISHGVTILAQKVTDKVVVQIARSSSLLPPVLEFYDKAYDVFTQFMKDFVRVHVYPRLQQFVPSSTRGGVDALRKVLLRNRELYRYEETERGDLEGILGEYLAGETNLTEVVTRVLSTVRPQSQVVSREQVGMIENVLPDVVQSPVERPDAEGGEFVASPPILRERVESTKKILTTEHQYRQLNNFTMLLGLSDRLMKTESEFFRAPHTTRIIWAGHRVIYIFTESTGRLSLYYDIELKEPIPQSNAGGGMYHTTTLITRNRIFVPVPHTLAEEFKITTGPKEFFVRFDVLASDVV